MLNHSQLLRNFSSKYFNIDGDEKDKKTNDPNYTFPTFPKFINKWDIKPFTCY